MPLVKVKVLSLKLYWDSEKNSLEQTVRIRLLKTEVTQNEYSEARRAINGHCLPLMSEYVNSDIEKRLDYIVEKIENYYEKMSEEDAETMRLFGDAELAKSIYDNKGDAEDIKRELVDMYIKI